MYEKFFSLAHRPFSAAPNLECIVAHEGYVSARERLLRCLTDGCGMAVLTAPAGLGKSLLCQDLQSRLRGLFTVAYLCSAQFPNRKAMLQAMLFELGAEYLGLSEDEARLCVTRAAQEAAERGRSLIVIIDEAHLVSTELLQELRSLAEPSPRCATPIRLMLAGQFELEERLADPELESLNQRIACHAILEPLTVAESAEYIHERLAIAGAKTQTFTEESLAFIVKAADGNPRALHQLCDHCLLSAYTIEEKPVSLETARNSLDDLRALPLHWNDAGLLDDTPDAVDETEELIGDEEFVATVDPASLALELPQGAAGSVLEIGDAGALWGDVSDLGVFEVGGVVEAEPTDVDAAEPPAPDLPEAALFASVAPWPAVPVESIGSSFGAGLDAETQELDAPAIAEPACASPAAELPAGGDAGLEQDLIEDAAEEYIDETEAAVDDLVEAAAESAATDGMLAESVDAAAAEDLASEDLMEIDFSQQDPPAVEANLEADIDECEEDTAIEAVWSPSAELLDELEPEDFDDEELVIDDRYAALDRASESMSTYFPKAPELLQFLSQYSVNHEPRRGGVAAAMHQSAVEVAEPETDTHEEELLETIRNLQEQLRQAAVERPRPAAADAWQQGRGSDLYDIVEPPEEPEAVVAPVIEPRAVEQAACVPAAAAAPAEPVKSRFAQLFSRMRQRRREVEDRLRKNADWI